MSVYSDDDYDRACRKIAALASDCDDPKLTLEKARKILMEIQSIAEGGDEDVDL